MELDFIKKNRHDRMMRSKSFKTQEVRDRLEGSRKVERLSHFLDNRRCLPDRRKKMQERGKIENMKKKINARERKVLQHGIGDFACASGSGRGEVHGSREKFSWKKGGAERQTKLLRARGLAEIKKVASGSAMQSLWLGNKKVGSQVVGKDRVRLPGIGTVGEVGEEEDEEEELATERRREYTYFGQRDKHVTCHTSALALAMTDEACGEAEM